MKKLFLTLTLALFVIPFTGVAQSEQRYANGTATDQDGNVFEWINYGAQDWAIENAEVVTYRDGTEIPQVTDDTEWANLTTGAWCYYDNDPSKGKLYNWYAVVGIHDTDPNTPNKEFAPEGWEIPSNIDVNDFYNFLTFNYHCSQSSSTETNWISKSIASKTNWNQVSNTSEHYLCTPGYNPNDNNVSGFNLMPNGNRQSDGMFSGEGSYGLLISKTEFDDNSVYNRVIFYNGVYMDGWYANSKRRGSTVRFVRDASSEDTFDILLNGTVSAENHQIKNVANPTYAQDAVTKSYVDNSVSNTYTQSEVDAIISEAIAGLQDQIDALQSTSGSGTVKDQDGNSYPYLTYGDQVWTVKNAEMVTYRDGTPIPQVNDDTEWVNLTTGAWCYYDNDPSKGKLYNWYAVAGIHDNDENTPNKDFAPEGWHVPSDSEWTELENYLIANGYNYDGTITGNKIAKAMASTTGWDSSIIDGAPGNDQFDNNSSGFSALPTGTRYTSFSELHLLSVFWSSTHSYENYSWFFTFSYDDSSSFIYGGNLKTQGMSIRFVKD